MINRSQSTKQMTVNIVGSSTFGRYPKMSSEKTNNMFMSDDWMVPYAGYKTAITADKFGNASVGRGVYTSTKLNKLIAVFDDRVYAIQIFYDENANSSFDPLITFLGNLETSTGFVSFAENNRPQIAICDGIHVYIYDPLNTQISNKFYIATGDGNSPSTLPINFTPIYVDFHDTYFLVAAKDDKTYSAAPPIITAVNNTWRLSSINSSTGRAYFNSDASTNANVVGLLSTKPDNTQAVVRFPSRGDMIFVMGSIVSEAWHDLGLQIFPYQRSPSFNIDYGCLSSATIARTDEMVVWLAKNEKSGPVIMVSEGGPPEKITSDGIDYLFSQMEAPEDSRAFIYRQDGHLFYHINFYTDNISLFYDFNTKKFYHACDENGNYFIADTLAYIENQYYFVTRNNGNLYAFDTIYNTYDGLEIPRFRICRGVKLPSQEYFIANDLGFTIEQGETDYQMQESSPLYMITQDGRTLVTQGAPIFFETQDDNYLETQNDINLISQQGDPTYFDNLLYQQGDIQYVTPRVDLSISTDGGQYFGNKQAYELNPIGKRKNRLMWWRIGAANDLTCMFQFWGLGRFVATDGIINIRQ